MKAMKILGVILILLGALALAFRRITYTTRNDVINIGNMHAQVQTKRIVPLPPLFGALTVLGGIVLIVAARKSS